jgi:Fe-S-cluster formation regulator IscX/YfhJ
MRIKLNDNDTKLITETVKKIVHLVDEARDPEFLTRKVLEAIQQEYPAV